VAHEDTANASPPIVQQTTN